MSISDRRSNRAAGRLRSQVGGTMLIELMVALSLAGIAIAAAVSALMIAREAATAIREMALLQQQASFALRSIGRHIRSAGSLELEASPVDPASFRFALPLQTVPDTVRILGTDGGANASDSLTLVHTAPPLLPGFQRDCLGQKALPAARTHALFQVDAKGNLGCESASGQTQPLIAGVVSFKLRFRVSQGGQVRSMLAGDVEAAQLWTSVNAVEVCLELHGEQRVTTSEHSYTGCSARSASDEGRMTLVTRKLFLLNASSEG